jgi:hypothetical protein
VKLGGVKSAACMNGCKRLSADFDHKVIRVVVNVKVIEESFALSQYFAVRESCIMNFKYFILIIQATQTGCHQGGGAWR